MFELLLASDARALAQDALLVILVGIALVWGAAPERAAIGIWIVCIELPSLFYNEWLGKNFVLNDVDVVLASVDIAAGAFWILLALYANRNYTLFIAGAQLLAISSHVARGLVEAISPIGYIFLVVAPGWIILLIMLGGFVRHIRRNREHGKYRDWRIVRRPIDGPTLKRGRLA